MAVLNTMTAMLSKVNNWVERFAVNLAWVLLFIITLLNIVQVFYRYVLNDSLFWSEELIDATYNPTNGTVGVVRDQRDGRRSSTRRSSSAGSTRNSTCWWAGSSSPCSASRPRTSS